MARKILLINTTFGRGGAAKVAQDLFHFLNQNGFDAYFAYGRGEKSGQDKTFKFGNYFETLLHVFLVRFFGLEGYGSYFSTKKLIKYIEKEKFNVIHLHNLHGYYLNFFHFTKFLNKSGIKVVWTLHDEWLLTWLPAHSMGCLHCKGEGGKCMNTYSYPKTYNKIFLQLMLKRKQKMFGSLDNLTIISPADWLAEQVAGSYLKKKELKVIHNGVDIDLFKPVLDKTELRKSYNLPLDKKIILFSAGNLKDENKGMEYIIELADSLKYREYLILGVGEGRLAWRDNIKVLGYVADNSIMAEILGVSDLFCITSKVETQPLSVLEALSSGLPVVGFDIPATREIVNEEIGSLVPFGGVEELSEVVVLNTMIDIMERKSKNARNNALTKFSGAKFFENYKNLYQEILK